MTLNAIDLEKVKCGRPLNFESSKELSAKLLAMRQMIKEDTDENLLFKLSGKFLLNAEDLAVFTNLKTREEVE